MRKFILCTLAVALITIPNNSEKIPGLLETNLPSYIYLG